jgi:hypothetical protein
MLILSADYTYSTNLRDDILKYTTKDSLSKGLLCIYALPVEIPEDVPVFCAIFDSDSLFKILSNNPKIHVIAQSHANLDYITRRLSNPVSVVYEAHCNNDREIREDRPVKVVGYQGDSEYLQLDTDALRKGLEELGLELKILPIRIDSTRQECCDFYKTIDIALAFRKSYYRLWHPPELKGTAKLIAPGSFKIPIVAYPDYIYRKMNLNCYLPAHNLEEVLKQCKLLKESPMHYKDYSNRVFEFAKDKHITTIAKEYSKLLNH